jgi:hypothetical protein
MEWPDFQEGVPEAERLARLPGLNAAELDELGVAVTERIAQLSTALAVARSLEIRAVLDEHWRLCFSLSTAIAEARLSLRS